MGRIRDLVVQQSFPDPKPTTNPYIVMLRDALVSTSGVRVQTFSWRRVLLGRYDVFHAHWPEILVDGASPLKAVVRQGLFVVLLLRLGALRTPIVRTQHNLELPSGLNRVQRGLLIWFDRATTLRIALNEHTPGAQGAAGVVIPHGHYRAWFSRYPRAERVTGRLGYFGLIRRYKNVESLIRVFEEVPGPYTLHIAGKPSTDDLAESLRALSVLDDRVSLHLAFLTDEELVQVATASELVVLPYTHMHNSGGVLAALSLDVPVLIPRTPTNTALAAEVGPGWVHQYDGDLDVEALRRGLDEVRTVPRAEAPDLTGRDWDAAGTKHLEAYRRALALRRG
jgi:beta-1,4-mannosyltransferase